MLRELVHKAVHILPFDPLQLLLALIVVVHDGDVVAFNAEGLVAASLHDLHVVRDREHPTDVGFLMDIAHAFVEVFDLLEVVEVGLALEVAVAAEALSVGQVPGQQRPKPLLLRLRIPRLRIYRFILLRASHRQRVGVLVDGVEGVDVLGGAA